MEQRQRPAQRPRLTREELAARRRRRRLRLVRNWVLFLSGCGALVGVMTGLLLWAMPQLSGLVAGRQEFAAPSYDLSGYLFDPDDPYLVLVNGQLPMSENDQTAPALAAAQQHDGKQRHHQHKVDKPRRLAHQFPQLRFQARKQQIDERVFHSAASPPSVMAKNSSSSERSPPSPCRLVAARRPCIMM